MADKKRTWANRQIIWGWVFLISMTAFFIYLLFAIWLPPISDGGSPAPVVDQSTPSSLEGLPPIKATALSQAQATLDVAAQQPIQAASSVREAAKTVIAATEESFQTPAVDATKRASEVATAEGAADAANSAGEESALPALGWVDWVLSAIPGLTAILSFVGLVFSSIMKWRSDLQDVGRNSVEYERERLQFEMQKQRFELDRVHQEALLQQQRTELELERERLELALMRQESRLASDPSPRQSLEEPHDASMQRA